MKSRTKRALRLAVANSRNCGAISKCLKKVQICVAVLLFLLLISPSKDVHATPEGWVYGQQVVYVNGQRFEAWGYSFWNGYGNFRLRDIAYMLNGTSAQFNVREPLDGYLHFWIERNVPYVPIGTELGYLYEEQLDWRTIGAFRFYAVEHSPRQSVILSLDGSETPRINTVVEVLTSSGFPINEPERLTDLNQVYFDIASIAGLLGFSLERAIDYDFGIPNELHITTGLEYLAGDIESQPLELLNASFRLTGHWVDRRFFDSVIINQEVAWPHEFEIGLFGLTYHPQFVDFQFSGLPLAARQPNISHHNQVLLPLVLESLEDGIITISIYGSDRRISADLSAMPIDTLIYYVDGVPIEMVRLDPSLSPGRYRHDALEGGGLLLTYIADFQSFSFWQIPQYVHIYRSTVQGYEGERIFTHLVIDENDRIFFEFADPYAEPDVVYFYTIKIQSEWHNYNTVTFGGESQITAYFDYVPSDAVVIGTGDTEMVADIVDPHESPEYAAETPSDSNSHMIAIIVAIVVVAGIFIFIWIKTMTKRA